MFRKFLLACMVMATFTMQIQAISINELNSSSQFKNVYQKSYPYEGGSIQNKLISVNVNIRMYNFDDVQCTVIPSVAYGFVTGMNLQLC